MTRHLKMALSAIVLCCILNACTDKSEDFIPSSLVNNTQNEYITNSPKVELAEALLWADNLFDIMGVKNTRSGRFVESVDIYNSEKTRSGNSFLPDTLLYLVNYSNNEGFALLGADRRIPTVYAISDQGHLEFNDTIENKGLSLFMTCVKNELLCNEAFRPTDDNTQPIVYIKPNYTSLSKTYKIHYPCIASGMRDMGQWEPYNTVVKSNQGINVPVGCVPLALATILGYYEYPKQWDGITLNWQDIKNDSECDAMQKLLYSLGKKENLNVSYSNEGSGAASYNCLTVLRKMGYQTPNDLISFNVDSALSTLSWNKVRDMAPIYMEGGQCDDNGNYIAKSMHAWIIDGVLERQKTMTPNPINNDLANYHLFHCIWGWYGVNNGYFRYTSSNGFETEPSQYDADDSQQKSKVSHHFKYFLKMFGFVRPPEYSFMGN